MFALIWGLLVALLKALGVVLAIYIFYWRVIDYFAAVRFYGAQGEDVVKSGYGHVPIFGSIYLIAWSAWKSWRDGDNFFIMKHLFDFEIANSDKNGAVTCYLTNGAGLGIFDVKVVEAMYTSKNKYFDKHPLIGDLAYCLTGDSILF